MKVPFFSISFLDFLSRKVIGDQSARKVNEFNDVFFHKQSALMESNKVC